MRTRWLQRCGLLAVASAAVLFVGITPSFAAAGDSSAYGVHAGVTLTGHPAASIGPAPTANSGGPTTAHLAGLSLANVVSARVLDVNAHTNHAGAEVQGVSVPLLSSLGSTTFNNVQVFCTATGNGIIGHTTLAGGTVAGHGAVTTVPNPGTTFTIAGIATVVLNEQIHNSNGSLTVNGVHITLLSGAKSLGSGSVIISSATCFPMSLPVAAASGLGLWIGLGLVAVVIPAGVVVARRRRTTT